MKRILFYAAPTDIKGALQNLETCLSLQFVEMGNRVTVERPVYRKVDDIPQPGIATNSTGSASVSYLVAPGNVEIIQNQADGVDGRKRWILANSENESSVVLTMAGIWKSDILLPGVMSTLHNTSESQEIMRKFLKSLKIKEFQKIGLYWVGFAASDILKMGGRLTPSEKSPSEYNLRF